MKDSGVDSPERLYYNMKQLTDKMARVVQKMNGETLELYLALTESEKEAVKEFIFSLLKNGSCYSQVPCPLD